jgi:endonuclease/exonuclease/phosphatase (EEP) superfamily protein YafD
VLLFQPITPPARLKSVQNTVIALIFSGICHHRLSSSGIENDLHSPKSVIKSWLDNSYRKEANNDAPNDRAGAPGPARRNGLHPGRTDQKERNWLDMVSPQASLSCWPQDASAFPRKAGRSVAAAPFETRRLTAECTAAGLASSVPPLTAPAPALNADGFSLVSWNIFKGNKEGWAEDFQKLSRNADILSLQEAYLTDRLKNMLEQGRYQWDMTAALEYRQIEAGVLTAARTAPTFTCAFRETEPITRIPKSVLITRYPLSGTALELLVANIHAINFTMGTSVFQKQIDRLEGLLATCRGPLIVSGDFNTWTAGRMSRVTAMAHRLGLAAVRFGENRRSRFFGHDVDHIYYRGLEAKNAASPDVSTSDHNPLTVVFNLADEPAPGH